MTFDYQTLLNEVAKFDNDRSRQFSIFEMLGQSSRELTHSAFIAQMLNPKGIHGMGSLFLSLFLKYLPDDFDFHAEGASVEIERDYGPKTGEGAKAKGGRIDIFLRDLSNRIIVIENKIYATDQKDQLQRYQNSISEESKETLIVYLTLDGHKPSNCHKEIPYHILSYKKEIIKWLKECLKNFETSHPLYNIIIQYMTTINTLVSDQQIMEILKRSSLNLKASLQIAKLADVTRQNLKKHFLTELGTYFGQTEAEIKQEGKEFILSTDGCDWCIEHNLFIRFHNPDSDSIVYWNKTHNVPMVNDANWIYVMLDNDKINFHDYNVNASLWLDKPEAFWDKFEKVFTSIRDTFGFKYSFNRNNGLNSDN